MKLSTKIVAALISVLSFASAIPGVQAAVSGFAAHELSAHPFLASLSVLGSLLAALFHQPKA